MFIIAELSLSRIFAICMTRLISVDWVLEITGGSGMVEELKGRDKLIKEFMENMGMSRKDAEFAADVELGKLVKGDVIEIEDTDKHG